MAKKSVTFNPTVVALTGIPFRFKPVIFKIVATVRCTPGTVFFVEGIDGVTSGRSDVIRLMLGDGRVCIQAILAPDLHDLVLSGRLTVGQYIRCEDVEARRYQPKPGRAVCLVVRELAIVAWDTRCKEVLKVPKPRRKRARSRTGTRTGTRTTTRAAKRKRQPDPEPDPSEDHDEEDDAFETIEYPKKHQTRPDSQKPKPQSDLPISLARDWHDRQTPLKLTALCSIPHLPYAQNWSCNVLAVIASLSPVEPSNLAPHKQRTARLAGPSTAKQVHLTVFLDPDNFSPQIGSVVLLVGVKNHRFDGGSLKKYASDSSQGQWWFENPTELSWCDVAGIQSWWTERPPEVSE